MLFCSTLYACSYWQGTTVTLSMERLMMLHVYFVLIVLTSHGEAVYIKNWTPGHLGVVDCTV